MVRQALTPDSGLAGWSDSPHETTVPTASSMFRETRLPRITSGESVSRLKGWSRCVNLATMLAER